MISLSRPGPLQRAASRLAHALSLLWLTSSAPSAFAATDVASAAGPGRAETALGATKTLKERSDELDS
jgi:hypothetical protein